MSLSFAYTQPHLKISMSYTRIVLKILFIGQSDAPKYDTIWSENGDMIDRFIPEILTFKVCPTRFKPKKALFFTFTH